MVKLWFDHLSYLMAQLAQTFVIEWEGGVEAPQYMFLKNNSMEFCPPHPLHIGKSYMAALSN